MTQAFEAFLHQRPIIGMLHLRPLPGAPLAHGSAASVMDIALRRAVADAQALIDGGCHGLMMENFGDMPFHPGAVPGATISAMAVLGAEIRRRFPNTPLGINVLRNDGCGALTIAASIGAAFIRVNVLTGARVTDQGPIYGIAAELLRLRATLRCDDLKILADVDVKHSAPLAARPIEDEVQDLFSRGLADGVIVSGRGTGAAVAMEHLQRVRQAAGAKPVLIGSGVSAATLAELAEQADAFIVGSAFKEHGSPDSPVAVARVRNLLKAHQELRPHTL